MPDGERWAAVGDDDADLPPLTRWVAGNTLWDWCSRPPKRTRSGRRPGPASEQPPLDKP